MIVEYSGNNLNSFREALGRAVIPIEPVLIPESPKNSKYDGDRFKIRSRNQSFGPFDFSRITLNPILLNRRPKHIKKDNSRAYLLNIQERGVGVVRQQGKEVELLPGDIALVDGTVPYSNEYLTPSRRFIARIPHDLIDSRIGGTVDSPLPAAKHHSGMSDIISDFFLSIDRNGRKLNSQEVQQVVERALDLLGVFLFNEESSATLYSSALLRRIKLFVETNYSNPDLDVQAIADAHGISNRYVHALFKSSRYSVSSYLWERRLQACRQQFEKPAFRNWSISQIAFANGFSDAAHFSRAFKKRFGVRATDYRKRPGGRA